MEVKGDSYAFSSWSSSFRWSSSVRWSSSFWWPSSRPSWSYADRLSDVMCKNPYSGDGGYFGCGQCLPCRVNRSRIWTTRITLEAGLWKENAFCTLTYSDDFLPVMPNHSVSSTATLVPVHLRNFLKRLRTALSPARVRFYAVGEYGRSGDRSIKWNPHYHIILFGYRTCDRGDSSLAPNRMCRCVPCAMVRKCWPFGRIHLGTVEPKSINYVSGYIVDKLRTEVRGDLNGRYPEFSRMSLCPAIGIEAMSNVAATYSRYELADGIDVGNTLRIGKSIMPLGRTLVRALRRKLGRDEKALPRWESDEMFLLRLRAYKDGVSARDAVIAAAAGKVASLEARIKRKGVKS